MSELLREENEPIAEVQEASDTRDASDSDADSLDSEGYDRLDPYAAMAKKIDRRNKVVQEFHKTPIMKASKTIIENRSSITFFEKSVLRYVICLALCVWLVYSNLTSQPSEQELANSRRSTEGTRETAARATKSWSSTLLFMVSDMQQEMVMLAISIGGYILVANINNYLDRVEQQE